MCCYIHQLYIQIPSFPRFSISPTDSPNCYIQLLLHQNCTLPYKCFSLHPPVTLGTPCCCQLPVQSYRDGPPPALTTSLTPIHYDVHGSSEFGYIPTIITAIIPRKITGDKSYKIKDALGRYLSTTARSLLEPTQE